MIQQQQGGGQFSSIYQLLQSQFGLGQGVQQQGPFPGIMPAQRQAGSFSPRGQGQQPQFGMQNQSKAFQFQSSQTQGQQQNTGSQSVWNPFGSRMQGRR